MSDRSDVPSSGITRRGFLAGAAAAAAAAAARNLGAAPAEVAGASPHVLPPLPWPEAALEPIISAKTIGFHYGKHHKGYVDNLNKLIVGTDFADMPLEKIVDATAGKPDRAPIFNNAAQIWNHTFYWHSMKPGAGSPPAALLEKIEASFGSFESLKKELTAAATSQFGSGYAWLVKDGDKLKVLKTANAENPMVNGAAPLLTIDIWEHAYYLDYQNRRADHVAAIVEKLLDWNFAAENLAKAK